MFVDPVLASSVCFFFLFLSFNGFLCVVLCEKVRFKKSAGKKKITQHAKS